MDDKKYADLKPYLEPSIYIESDDQVLIEPFDLIYELQQKSSEEKSQLTLLRNGESLTKTIHFSKKQQK